MARTPAIFAMASTPADHKPALRLLPAALITEAMVNHDAAVVGVQGRVLQGVPRDAVVKAIEKVGAKIDDVREITTEYEPLIMPAQS